MDGKKLPPPLPEVLVLEPPQSPDFSCFLPPQSPEFIHDSYMDGIMHKWADPH